MQTVIQTFPNWITDGCIFTKLNNLDVPWKQDITPLKLDYDYIGRSGNKYITPLVSYLIENDKLDDIINILYQKNIKNWNKLYETLSFDYNPIHNYDGDETETITITDKGTVDTTGTNKTVDTSTIQDTGTVTNNGSNNDSVFGFNSSSAVNDKNSTVNNTTTNNLSTTNNSSSDNNNTNKSTTDMTHTEQRTLTKGGNLGVTSTQSMIQQERDLWLWNYFEQVFSDIDKTLTLLIY